MSMPLRVHTQNHHDILMPDVEVFVKDPTHVYVPLQGWCSLLMVYNAQDNLVGWINTRTLGYETAGEWMRGTGWIDQGY